MEAVWEGRCGLWEAEVMAEATTIRTFRKTAGFSGYRRNGT